MTPSAVGGPWLPQPTLPTPHPRPGESSTLGAQASELHSSMLSASDAQALGLPAYPRILL